MFIYNIIANRFVDYQWPCHFYDFLYLWDIKSDAGVFGTVWELLDFQNGRHKMTQMANMFT